MTDTIILKFFAEYIEKHLGIVYTDANYFQLEHRLRDISHQLGLKDVPELYSKAQVSIEGAFKALLLDLATNNETSFYRDSQVFTALGKFIIPDLLRKFNNPASINIWSAAASSGQEVYTIAMELETMRKDIPGFPQTTIFATDISDTILKRAQAGIYSQLEVQRGLPARQLADYFDPIDKDQWQVKDFIKRSVSFAKLNLLDHWAGIGPFDIVYCRNVLIYQNVENKKKVLQQIHRVMKPGGYLILGAAESLFGLSDAFEQFNDEKTIVYIKKG